MRRLEFGGAANVIPKMNSPTMDVVEYHPPMVGSKAVLSIDRYLMDCFE